MKIVLMFVIACVIGLIWGVIRLIAGKGRLLPFGSMMAIASLILIFWGEEIVKWLYF
jgi:prepilin signal peptidase PulO-like enzyme (type II secretory pathway)